MKEIGYIGESSNSKNIFVTPIQKIKFILSSYKLQQPSKHLDQHSKFHGSFLRYVTIVVGVVIYGLTATKYMVENHIMISCILNGRLSLICVLNNVGVSSPKL